MAQTEEGEGQISEFEMWKVGQNVALALVMLLFFVMCVVGLSLLKDCPSQEMLSIYMILQGISAQTMPILYIIKYRCGVAIKRTVFLSIFITVAIISCIWFITGTHWLATAGCPDSRLYKAGVGLMVILWLAVIAAAIFLSIKGIQFLMRRQRDRVYPF